MKRLTIVTICYNDLEGLKKTIESLRCQSSHDFEQVIVDGGSSDGTANYLKDLSCPWNFSWSSEQDRGLYDAMNKGLMRSEGEFVWFLNSGDTCASSSVVDEVQHHLGPEVDIVYGKAWYVGPHGKKSVGKPVGPTDFLRGMPICHQSTIYRTSLLRQHTYPLEYRIVSDWVVTQRLFENTDRTDFIDMYIANFDLSGISAQNHFRVLKEKLSSETTVWNKAQVFFFVGGRFTAIWILKKTGLYSAFKHLQSRLGKK